MQDENENLSYISSVDPFAPEKDEPSVDIADEKALKRILNVLNEQIKLYHTLSGMKQFPIKFNADQREAMCNQYVELLLSLKQLIDNVLDGIKEKQK